MMHHCNYCPESFFSGYSLMSHLKIHNKEEPSLVFGKGISPNIPSVPVHNQYSSWQWDNNGPTTTTTNYNNGSNLKSGAGKFPTTKMSRGGSSISSSNSSSRTMEGLIVEDEDNNTNSNSNEEEIPTPTMKNPNIRTTVEKVYECPSCKKIFRSYPGLRYHRNAKHDQNGPYKCNFCERRFCQKSHLSRHETLHTGEKNYDCKFCLKKFRIKGNMQIHVRIHTGDKPYICQQCGKSFTQQQSLKSHERLHYKYK